MIRVLASLFTGIMRRWMPDAFLFAAVLTLFVLFAGMIVQSQSPIKMIQYWGDGIWNLLTFSMQVLMTLVTGHVLAQSGVVHGLLQRIAGVASSPRQAIVMMTAISIICCWINWGFGLIASALVAREIAQRVRDVHYPLLVAAAYSGMLIWHAGLSGSIPLKIASSDVGTMSAAMAGVVVPVSQTIFSPAVLIICITLLMTLPLLFLQMIPAEKETQRASAKPQTEAAHQSPTRGYTSPAERLENSPIVPFLLGAMGIIYLTIYFLGGGGFTLNIVNLIFLVLGILFHKTPASHLKSVNDAVKGTAGIVLQFPLYAGIMGMMVSSGLAVTVSQWFVSISTPATFPLLTFLSAGLINFFVPSGGGQWAVQGPIVIPAAEALGVPLNQAAMAVALGDSWTNMIQPFWALPLLAIAGLGIKDIMGYCTVALLWSGLLIGAGIFFLF